MKCYIVARGMSGRSDEELYRLGLLKYGPVHVTDQMLIEVADDMAEEFFSQYPECRRWDVKIVSDERK